jgi:hypothetical protein
MVQDRLCGSFRTVRTDEWSLADAASWCDVRTIQRIGRGQETLLQIAVFEPEEVDDWELPLLGVLCFLAC